MIDFIIYEKDEQLKNIIKINIYNIIGPIEDDFKIYDYNNYKHNNQKYKIYILSSFNFKKTMNISKEIRNSGDYTSPIIVISNLNKNELNNDLLILSYIEKNNISNCKIRKAITKAYNILINKDTFNFTFNRIIYQLPLEDILFIEKESNSNKSIIHTNDKNHEICATIKEIEKSLKYTQFIKIHRSCIININKVIRYDFVENTIYFQNSSTNLISREKRHFLKEKLLDNGVKVEN